MKTMIRRADLCAHLVVLALAVVLLVNVLAIG
jgi:hypothetical protein